MRIGVTPKQKLFLDATADEVLYGGAAGGGKSHGQILDALLYALRYPASKQLILRKTFPELEKSIIRKALEIYPQEIAKYNASKHVMAFPNGSLIDFGYLASENDVTQYQSAEYDVIRFDELTHFTEYMYVYMLSRLRGANSYPKQIKSSTNPGNVGHAWVKKRFVDPAPPGEVFSTPNGSRVFIPAKVQENTYLMQKDPGYIPRLNNLPETERKALLEGNWDIFEGQYFDNWDASIHVIKPFEIPPDWRVYRSIDYGLDMLACYWTAFDSLGRGYIFREFCKSNLTIDEAAREIDLRSLEPVHATFAPPDLWGRTKDTGRTIAEGFARGGVPMVKAKNDRVTGWLNLKEWLQARPDEHGSSTPTLRVFDTCRELIRCIPALIRDERNPNDCATEPHDITHSPDAIRYLVAGRPRPGAERGADAELENFLNYGVK